MIPKVHIGFCAGVSVLTKFTVSLMAFLRHDFAHQRLTAGDFTAQEGLYIDNNRDALVRSFLDNSRAEWLWTLDSDVQFAPDLLDLLIAEADPIERPILSALYVGRMGKDRHMVPVWLVDGHHAEHGYPYETVPELRFDGPQRLEAVGMGCCLIHRSVLVEMERRWRLGDISYADSPWIWYGRDSVKTARGIEPMGEDVCFCRRATECGFTIWGHAGVQVTHYKLEGLDYSALVDSELVREAKRVIAETEKQAA